MESFKDKDLKSVDGLSNTKGSLKGDTSKNELVQDPSQTFITGGAGMPNQPSEAASNQRGESKLSDVNPESVAGESTGKDPSGKP